MPDDFGSVDPALDESTWAPPLGHRQPAPIGPYTILQKLGEGGMGIVYLAEQSEPVRRRVALKVIKQGMDTAQVIARFEAERQALALMDHPAIATIHDAGTTPDGRPYFVMEYVQGVPITEHCDRQKLTNKERLELFLQVCEGVQHAHQKAVIHRDLKPSNILVSVQDGRPAVKIIDFGVAKAVSQRLTERTLYTELGVMIGTPEYMSPEQAEMTGQDVDTRTDVFALGVMLYELLVGALPFDPRELRQAGFDEIRRRIREVDPPKPSARLSTLGDRSTESARRRGTEPRALRREIQGDLDWITMRALEKDRARRYGSPSDLAEDIRRHLRHEPVLARAPSTGYRAGKFARRHRLGVAAATVMVVSLAAGAVVSAVGLVRARRAEAQARQEAEAKGQVADFLKNLFKVSNPSEARGNSITARELLDKAARTIDVQLEDQPEIRAELDSIMGTVYESLGLYVPAESLTSKALQARKNLLGSEHPETLKSMSDLATVFWRQGRYAEAERLGSETLDLRKRILGPEDPDTLKSMNNLANLYWSQRRTSEAERLHSQVLEIRRRTLGPEHPETLSSMVNLALAYMEMQRYAEAERLLSEVVEIRRRTLKPEDPLTLLSMFNLANAYGAQAHYPEAQRLFSDVLEVQKRVLGPGHPDTLRTMTNLTVSFEKQGRFPEAERLYSEILELRKGSLGPEHPDTLGSAIHLAKAYAEEGRLPEAESFLSGTIEIAKRALGPEHPTTLWAMATLGDVYIDQRRYTLAEQLYLRVLDIRRRSVGPANGLTLDTMLALAGIKAQSGDQAGGLRWLREVVEAGYRNPKKLSEGSLLVPLHGPEFEVLLEKVRRNASADRASAPGTRIP